MRVMVIVKGTDDSEAGTLPGSDLLEQMGRFNEELVKAGVLLAADGLKPTSAGKRVRFDGTGRTVVEGPFGPARDQIAGFWIWQVADMDEALTWVKRCPNPMPGPSEIEVRPLFEMADFADAITPDVADLHARTREAVGGPLRLDGEIED